RRAAIADGAAPDAAPPDVPRAAVPAPSAPCGVSSEPDRVGAAPSQPLSCTPAPDPSRFGPAQIQPARSVADKPLPRTDFCSTSARPTSSHVRAPTRRGEDTLTALTKWWNSRDRRGLHRSRSEEHTSELQSRFDLVCRLLL